MGCSQLPKKTDNSSLQDNPPTTIGDIAYDNNEKWGYTIYLDEGNVKVPYLVVTNSYDGDKSKTLLLRKELLPELHEFSGKTSYYGSSEIDAFLNNAFFNSLTNSIKSKIVETKLEITAESSIGIAGRELEYISRKIFLLSATEVGVITETKFPLIEGKVLMLFKGKDSEYARSVYFNGESAGWWLRTPDTRNDQTWICGREGIGFHQTYLKRGVRPAFCIPSDVKIEEGETSDKKIYVLKNNEVQ